MPGKIQTCCSTHCNDFLPTDLHEPSILKHNSQMNVNKDVHPIRYTGVVCTIGPACNTVPMIHKLLENGMNIARMNFSHGDHEYHLNVINTVREAAKKYLPETVAIALDTKGPEIRTGCTENNAQISLVTGSTITLTTDDQYKNSCNAERLYMDYKGLATSVKVDYEIYCADGYVVFKVLEILDDKNVKCLIKSGATIGSKKNCNLPGVKVDLPALSQKDVEDITFGIKNNIDMIFASFIRTKENVMEIRSLLNKLNAPHVKIISKIENQEGVDNINEVIDASDGIMVARGDLGMEVPIERVIIAQKIMISSCNIKGKPVICATQMLESMINNVRPTRAEVADVYNAVLDGSDCVMLSGETANGKFPDTAVATMSKTCLVAEASCARFRHHDDIRNNSNLVDSVDSISFAAASISFQLPKLHAIIVLSTSGQTAYEISRFRPNCPILLVSRYETTCRQSHLYNGVIPLLYGEKVNENWTQDVDNRLLFAVGHLRKWCVVKNGSFVAFITGWKQGKGSSNDLKILKINENGVDGLSH